MCRGVKRVAHPCAGTRKIAAQGCAREPKGAAQGCAQGNLRGKWHSRQPRNLPSQAAAPTGQGGRVRGVRGDPRGGNGVRDVDIGIRDVDIGVRDVDIGVWEADIGVREVDIGVRGVDIGVRDGQGLAPTRNPAPSPGWSAFPGSRQMLAASQNMASSPC